MAWIDKSMHEEPIMLQGQTFVPCPTGRHQSPLPGSLSEFVKHIRQHHHPDQEKHPDPAVTYIVVGQELTPGMTSHTITKPKFKHYRGKEPASSYNPSLAV